ncbi:solute carrier family 22 member 18-like [Branchiostoma floridae]|uniref:Organic cation transporter-like protein 2 n=1 Tax=Branchiostoma floridae TaxID=7739 RepID=A0A9J7HIB2_BRAFL|nr:solute carrier family 22 member 18-like [Branchiostoma floridae]
MAATGETAAMDGASGSKGQGQESHEEELTSASGLPPSQRKLVLLMTHLNIAMYSTCFWIQQGALPYLTKKLGVDPVVYGYLQTTFAVVQLCGGPLFGRFGDLFGTRSALVLAFSAAAMSYGLLGMAEGMLLLFLSRLPSFLMHSMQGAQMIVTDISDEGNRADALGKLGLSYGIGMIVGPFLGGQVTKYFSEQHSAYLAMAGSLVSIVLVVLFIPSNTKAGKKDSDSKKEDSGPSSVFDVKAIAKLLTIPVAAYLLLVRTIVGTPLGIFQSMFSVIAMDRFNIGPEENGYLMSYIGMSNMVMMGLGVGILTKRYNEGLLLKWAIYMFTFGYLLLAGANVTWHIYVTVIPLTIGGTIMNTVISSTLTKVVPPDSTGTMLGLSMASNSIIRTMSPTVGGLMLGYAGYPSFGVLGFVVNTLLSVYMVFSQTHAKVVAAVEKQSARKES